MDEKFSASISWLLKDEKGKNVCNFFPKVLGKIDIINRDGERIDSLLKLQLFFADGTHGKCEVKLSECDKINWSKLDQRCIVSHEYHKVNEYIGMRIRSEMRKVSSEKIFHLNALGIHKVGEEVVFCAGDRVITRFLDKESNLNFDIAKLPFRMEIDSKLDPTEAFDGMKELISLSPEIGRVLVAHVISGIMRTAFKKAGFIPCAVLVIIGKSGMLKSHYVPQLVQLYNRADEVKPVTRFNSSQSFIEAILSEYSECTAVIDDLHSAASKSIKSRNENTAEEIIRRISDDTGRGHKEGNALVQEKFRGNAVFIGEYMFGKDSTIPRALVVEITKRPDGKILDKYQRQQPLLVSTFYYFFIQWYVDHFNEIRDEIDVRLTKFRETMTDSGIHGRLCDTQFYLQISYMVFLEFCKESGFISQEDCLDEYKFFCQQVANLIQIQQERFRYGSGTEEVDYLKHIQKLYKEGRFRVAEGKKTFKPDKHDGVICYDCLCLRGKCLEQKLKNINARFSLEDCVKYLLAQDALKLVEQKNTVQINGTGGKRFYAIKLSKLH